MNKHFFFKYDKIKWDWTRSAVNKFMNGFKRFDGYIEEKEQVYIGVYGPTQVGKTTFILSLLGIDFKQLSTLSDALRGGQIKGKSATVTCTIFQKTDSGQFRITWPSGEVFTCSTLKEVEQVMQNLRMKIYHIDNFSLAPLLVEIPKQYFDQSKIDERIRDLSIIDLPGDDSKDEMEMRHVNRILKEYISRCKVCVIMEIASQMTGLTKLDKDLVKDWMVLPEQFRIVLTRSITNGSAKKAIESHTVHTAEEFRALYIKEMTRICEMDELGTAIYPLEFGDSWVDLKNSQPSLFNKTNPWVEEIFAKLVEDLTQINAPEQEIKKLKSMERYILKKQEQELAKLEEEKENLSIELNHTNSLIEKLKRIKEREEKTFASYKYLDQLDKLNSIKERDYTFPSWKALNFAEKKASYLTSRYSGFLTDLEEEMLKYTEELNNFIRKFNLYENENSPIMEFPGQHFQIQFNLDYVIDRYFQETTYILDTEIARGKLLAAFNQYKAEYQKAINFTVSKVENLMTSKRLIIEEYKTQVVDQEKVGKEIKKSIEFIEEQIKKAESEWNQDRERSKQLDLFLMESFVQQSDLYKAKMLDNKTSTSEKWIVHQYWNVLKLQAERIIDHVN